MVVSGLSDGTIEFWNLHTGKAIRTLKWEPEDGLVPSVKNLAISADGKTLVSGSSDVVNIWDVETGKLTRTLQNENITLAVTFNSKTNTVASGEMTRTIRLWDLKNGKLIRTFLADEYIHGLAFGPDGRMLFGGDGTEFKLWQISPKP